MNDKIKKILIITLCQAAIMAAVFAILLAVNFFSPQTIDKISAIWTKTTDVERALGLASKLLEELIPF